MPKKTPKERIEEVQDTLKTQIHHSECRFHAKYIDEEQHHKELDHFTDKATNSILKILKDSIMSEEELREFFDNKQIRVFNMDYMDARITGKTAYNLAKAIREQQLKELQ